jgi:predicted transcriptional regulator
MITLQEIVEELGLTVRTGQGTLEQEVTGGYASDLLSCVMAGAEAGNIWVTLQAHANVIAVAVLLELSAVIVTEGTKIDEPTLAKARQEGIALCTTEDDTFATVSKLAQLGVAGHAA